MQERENDGVKFTDRLAKAMFMHGIKRVYGLQGGSVAHIFDSLEKYEIGVDYLHHEESCAFAAITESLIGKQIGVLVVTTGPAGTNALTGILGAWQDSIPLIVISGQARSNQLSYGRNVRQFGSQEAPIIDIVRPITKATFLLTSRDNVEEILSTALDIANRGRPGPVWIDIPIDVQLTISDDKGSSIHQLRESKNMMLDIQNCNLFVENIILALRESLRPVVILGGGVKSFLGESEELLRLLNGSKLPIILTWTSSTLANKLDNYIGISGPFGHESTNAYLKSSDLILAVGTNLGSNSIGSNLEWFTNKRIFLCNIDAEQVQFIGERLKVESIVAESSLFLAEFLLKLSIKDYVNSGVNLQSHLLRDYASCFSSLVESFNRTGFLHSHGVVESLTRTGVTNLVIDGGGTALYSGFQGAHLENVSKVICLAAISSMGTALAQSIPFNDRKEVTLVVIGDGSFFMSLRDLASLKGNQKLLILVINNKGYLAIRHTQAQYLDRRFLGTFYDQNCQLPSIEPVVQSFGFKYLPLRSIADLERINVNNIDKVTIAEAFCDPEQPPMWHKSAF